MKIRICLVIAFLYLSNFVYAQSTFLYIDISGNIDRDVLKNELSLYTEKWNNTICFISNDNTPLVGKSLNEFKVMLEDLSTIKPSTPISYNEIDTIITILDTIQMPLDLVFFLDLKYTQNGGLQNLVERLLLSNGWLNKDGLKSGISVKLYFQKNDYNLEQYFKELSKNSIYEIYQY